MLQAYKQVLLISKHFCYNNHYFDWILSIYGAWVKRPRGVTLANWQIRLCIWWLSNLEFYACCAVVNVTPSYQRFKLDNMPNNCDYIYYNHKHILYLSRFKMIIDWKRYLIQMIIITIMHYLICHSWFSLT